MYGVLNILRDTVYGQYFQNSKRSHSIWYSIFRIEYCTSSINDASLMTEGPSSHHGFIEFRKDSDAAIDSIDNQ